MTKPNAAIENCSFSPDLKEAELCRLRALCEEQKRLLERAQKDLTMCNARIKELERQQEGEKK